MSAPPTGPTGDQFPAFEADPYAYLVELGERGDIVGIDLGGIPTAVVYDLAAIHKIFADRLVHIGRAAVFERLSHVTGNGILTNYDWDSWQPRRSRIIRPLGSRQIGRFHERMVAIIDEELAAWPVEEEFDLFVAVRSLTLRIVADLLFTEDLDEHAQRVIERAVDEIHAWAESDPSNADLQHEPESFREAVADLDAFIADVMARRDPADPGSDMIGVLLDAAADDGPALDAVGVRDEAVTLILAGHDTVTGAIAFALDLLARNPGARSTAAGDIVNEAMRLYPPVHMTAKGVVADIDLGEVTVPAGWELLVPEYVIYRNARYFERPDEFLPQRWNDDSHLVHERRAFFPFLTGPKFCVGRHFALMEATEVVERFVSRFDHEMLDPTPPEGRPFALTFSPDRPMPCRLSRR